MPQPGAGLGTEIICCIRSEIQTPIADQTCREASNACATKTVALNKKSTVITISVI
jgi:hypothetical protein